MFTRLMEFLHLTRGEKAFVSAYAIVIAISAGLSMLVMTGVEGPRGIPQEPSLYVLWIIFAGALSGGISLFIARGWMGRPGALGIARAIVGSIAVAIIGAVLAGTLILPVYGTFYGPFLLLSAFIAKPWIAIAWFAALLGAHYLMVVLTEEIAYGAGRSAQRSASSQLSALTRAQLYRRD